MLLDIINLIYRLKYGLGGSFSVGMHHHGKICVKKFPNFPMKQVKSVNSWLQRICFYIRSYLCSYVVQVQCTSLCCTMSCVQVQIYVGQLYISYNYIHLDTSAAT